MQIRCNFKLLHVIVKYLVIKKTLNTVKKKSSLKAPYIAHSVVTTNVINIIGNGRHSVFFTFITYNSLLIGAAIFSNVKIVARIPEKYKYLRFD